MGSRKIVLVLTAGFSFLNTGIFWREAKTKRLFSQCNFRTYHHLPKKIRETQGVYKSSKTMDSGSLS
jgi:hypothetical protein